MILHGTKYLECVKEGLSKSAKNRLAVAFWGEGAIRSLGIERPENHEILCNLTMGGTNPEEIKLLIDQGFSVRHSPRLHAKVYRFDDAAVVGSANASANGLGFEGCEMSGWSEVGVLVTDPEQLREIDRWWEREFAAARPVGRDDLRTAAKRHGRARQNRPPVLPEKKFRNLLEALATAGQDFRDRPIYLVCNNTELSRQGRAQQKAVKQDFGEEFDVYENWDTMPIDAYLIEFWDKGKGKFSFLGFYSTDKKFGVKRSNGNDYQRVMKVKRISMDTGFDTIFRNNLGPMGKWGKILADIKARSPQRWKKENGCCVQLSDIAQRFEANQSPLTRPDSPRSAHCPG
ncbi:hypothetical protein [Rhodoblastus sp.]|uniref:hypothetical protein n=1 Tax=Rhodoblastus sp. TaxID=1962975 RepID=UPI003F9D7D1A